MKQTRYVVYLSVLLAVTFLAACAPGEVEPGAPEVGPVVPFGELEIRDLQPTVEVVSNCAGVTEPIVKHPSIIAGTSHSVEWQIGGTLGVGLQIGSDLAPASVNLEAALEGHVARDVNNSIQFTNAWDLPADPGYIMEYTIMWREIWQPGYIDATFLDPEPEIIRIDVKYRTGIQSEIVGESREMCPSTSTPSSEASLIEPSPSPSLESSTTKVDSPGTIGFRLCNRDATGDRFAQTDASTGIARIELLPEADVFFLSTDPATITFSPGSGLSEISSDGIKQFVILGANTPNLEWIEISTGYAYTACIYSADLLPRAQYEATVDMDNKTRQNVVWEFYEIDGSSTTLTGSFP